MPVTVQPISEEQAGKIFSLTEGHFVDFKAKEIAPGKLTKTISAFSNADGAFGECSRVGFGMGIFEWPADLMVTGLASLKLIAGSG